jgi:hypothetical protein
MRQGTSQISNSTHSNQLKSVLVRTAGHTVMSLQACSNIHHDYAQYIPMRIVSAAAYTYNDMKNRIPLLAACCPARVLLLYNHNKRQSLTQRTCVG